MRRLTQKDLDAKASSVNRYLKEREGASTGAGLHVQTGRRNGNTALDLYDGTECLTTLTVGTMREAHDYLSGMTAGLGLAFRADNRKGGK